MMLSGTIEHSLNFYITTYGQSDNLEKFLGKQSKRSILGSSIFNLYCLMF